MLKCDGYKMFHGTVKVTPVRKDVKPFDVTGTWLYKPAEAFGIDAPEGCWYCNEDCGGWTGSWTPDILSDFRDDAGDA